MAQRTALRRASACRDCRRVRRQTRHGAAVSVLRAVVIFWRVDAVLVSGGFGDYCAGRTRGYPGAG